MSLEVKIWDGRLGATDLRDGRNEVQVNTLGKKEKYVKVHQQVHQRSIDEVSCSFLLKKRKKKILYQIIFCVWDFF